MKKPLSLLLVIVLIGPWLALLCQCCPQAHAATSQTSSISSKDCGCCAPLQLKERERGDFLRSLTSISLTRVLSFIFVLPALSERTTPETALGHSSDSGPPPISSPLYLSLQTLRL